MTEDGSPPPDGPAPARVPEGQRGAAALVRAVEELVDDVARRPFSRDLIRRVDWLLEILVDRGYVTPSHAASMRRIKGDGSVVRLALYQDKRAVESSDMDCASLLPLCKGRCCAMDVSLSAEDLAERVLEWDLSQPYLLRKNPAHGYCACLGGDGRCTVYEARPGACRSYDCRDDPRVWLDFDNKVPAPLQWFLVAPEQWGELAAGRRPPVELPVAEGGHGDDDGDDDGDGHAPG